MDALEKIGKRLQGKKRKYAAVSERMKEQEKIKRQLECEMKQLQQQLEFMKAKKIRDMLEKEGLNEVNVNDLTNVIVENKERLLGGDVLNE